MITPARQRHALACAVACACASAEDATDSAPFMPSTGAHESSGALPSDGSDTIGPTMSTSGTDEPGESTSAATADPDTSTGAQTPEFDDIPWQVGEDIGYGIAYKDTLAPDAASVFIGYAGYPFPLDAAQSWVRELWHVRLRELGVRHVYAVQGPADVPYSGLEIGNSHIAEALAGQIGADGFVLVAAHSSGTYVAHELFGQLVGGLDPQGLTADRVVYFNLDGGLAGIDGEILEHLRRAYFVSAYDHSSGTAAANLEAMQYAGDMWSYAGGYIELDASESGCSAGAAWCLHMAVINALPHDPDASSVDDYYDFAGRPVVTGYIDAKAREAGLLP